ncbi:rhodanese-like domain-containing protein [Aquisphaera insulae]|uniref:rhodanese-like domain-containing protein n=1 Tax=Aquisphaera insulae TaxID=2712864 RepID=UPI00202E5D75|nr:rhodanese-like domain-containing protein [Aquisphaera insulae]
MSPASDPNPFPEIPELAPLDVQRRLRSGEPMTLLDVREPMERTFCAIAVPATAGDLHLPMRQVPAHLEMLIAAAAKGPLVIYCHHGVRSMAIAEWLTARGVAGVHNLRGGIDAWSLQADAEVPRYG